MLVHPQFNPVAIAIGPVGHAPSGGASMTGICAGAASTSNGADLPWTTMSASRSRTSIVIWRRSGGKLSNVTTPSLTPRSSTTARDSASPVIVTVLAASSRPQPPTMTSSIRATSGPHAAHSTAAAIAPRGRPIIFT